MPPGPASLLLHAVHAGLWLAAKGGRKRRRLTDLNPHLDGIAQGSWHRYAFRTAHGGKEGAVILTPPGWQPGTPCPTVVNIYPGHAPSRNLDGVGRMLEPELLAAQGYAVLLPDVPYDPRGAADPIEAAPAAVLPAVQEAIRLGYADPARLAVVGASYGGTAVLGLLTRTGRFCTGRWITRNGSVPSLGARRARGVWAGPLGSARCATSPTPRSTSWTG